MFRRLGNREINLMALTASIEKPVAKPISKFAVPFLGFLGGVCPDPLKLVHLL
ncbi:hypothetical protein MCETE7_01914 [Acidimicrobiia bacterium]